MSVQSALSKIEILRQRLKAYVPDTEKKEEIQSPEPPLFPLTYYLLILERDDENRASLYVDNMRGAKLLADFLGPFSYSDNPLTIPIPVSSLTISFYLTQLSTYLGIPYEILHRHSIAATLILKSPNSPLLPAKISA